MADYLMEAHGFEPNDLFLDFLKKYIIPDQIIPIIKTQLIKIYNCYNEGNAANDTVLKSQLEKLEKKLKDVKFGTVWVI